MLIDVQHKVRKVCKTKAENYPRNEDEVYLTCGNRNNAEMRMLVGETFDYASLNSACSSTVCCVD